TGEAGRWFITRGHGGFQHGSRIWYASPERKSGGGKGRNIKLLNMATDRLKDTVFAMLGRVETGTGALLAGSWMTGEQIAELVAEERLSKGWEKKPGQVRNETLDLSVQARALAEHKGLLRLAPGALPDWAVGGLENPNAVPLAQAKADRPDPAPDAAPAPETPPEAPAPRPRQTAPRRINFLKR
ncbi:phage terminase large subunit family protein, partial [Rhodovulum visakhapatnamense]|uniref:terminase gpA endonuclease subunit n=1 Tax=Rhodovulum visakhapatnamense TaxID=364297 RepID=UPI001924CB92